MEARWQIETQGPTRARHGGRAEKNKHGVDTMGLLMEAEFEPIADDLRGGSRLIVWELPTSLDTL